MRLLRNLSALCLAVFVLAGPHPAHARQPPQAPGILPYIHASWDTLTRSLTSCATLADPKIASAPILYLPAAMPVPAAVVHAQQTCHIEVRSLPIALHHLAELDPARLPRPGLLYLPNPYVVPGGRFNEMYGWDSYFILLGLLHDHRLGLARGMVDNFLFEIKNYGEILNANRTYYLTRSQPPFLSSMIRAVYEASSDEASPGEASPGTAGSGEPRPDRKWLAHAYALAVRDHKFWTSPPHLAGSTGLSRYFDLGTGPVPEMDDDSTYYPDVIRWLLAHPAQKPEAPGYLITLPPNPSPQLIAQQSCDPSHHTCANAHVLVGNQDFRLTPAFYAGDRAMRESGFDTTFRFGPFSGSTQDYAPVCLNALLYKYERDLAHIAALLHKPAEAAHWLAVAAARKAAIDTYLWNPRAGLYFDFRYTDGTQSTYPFLSAFYPLWAGAAGPAQAASLAAHLPDFAQPGGLAMSTVASGTQWDLPYGWAPATLLAILGLHQYHHDIEALPAARNFNATILANFLRDGTIREKYNVADGSANIQVAAGYKSNVVGFGWTNATYLLLNDLLNP